MTPELYGNTTHFRNGIIVIAIQWFKMSVKILLLLLIIVKKSLQILVLIHSCVKCSQHFLNYSIVFQ